MSDSLSGDIKSISNLHTICDLDPKDCVFMVGSGISHDAPVSMQTVWSFVEDVRMNVCDKCDILIFKSITDRPGDTDDCINLIKQGGIDWMIVLDEITY